MSQRHVTYSDKKLQ